MQERRVSNDKTHKDIRELILQTDQAKDKAMLLILLKISENLETNTELTQGVSETVEKHIERYETHETREAVLVGQAKVAWFVLSAVLVLVQGVALYAIKSYSDDYRYLNTAVIKLRSDMDILQERRRIEDEIKKAQR